MGQKVNPFGYRLGSLYGWASNWFAQKGDYEKFLLQDVKLRKFLLERLKPAGIVKVDIERSINKIRLIIHVSRPGVVIGRGGSGMELLKKEIEKLLGIDSDKDLKIDVEEVKNPDLSAHLVAQRLTEQLVRRYPHRRAISNAMEKVMNAGAKGIKIVLAGRIAGAEISRREKYSLGSIPLQTLRADIDYVQTPALTKSGYIGVKVWIYKGEKEIR